MRIPMDLLEENGGDPPEGESQEAAAAGAAGGPALEAAAAGAAEDPSLVAAAVTAGDELPEQAAGALREQPPQLGKRFILYYSIMFGKLDPADPHQSQKSEAVKARIGAI